MQSALGSEQGKAQKESTNRYINQIREEKGKRGEGGELHTEDKQITLKQNFIKLYLALILTRQQTIRIPIEEPWLGSMLC